MNLQDYAAEDLERLKQEGGGSGVPAASPAASSDPMQDPGFRAFVAQRAQQMKDLSDAQQAAADRRASAGFKIGNALTAFGGGDVNARYEQAGQPVKDVLARQQASRDITEGASKDVGLSGEILKNKIAGEGNDPNSPYSRAMAQLLRLRPELAGKFTANMAPAAEKQGQLDVENRKATTEKFKAEHPGFEENKTTGQLFEKLTGKYNGPAVGGKEIPPNVEKEVASLIAGAKGIDTLDAERESTGVLGALADKFGFGDYHNVKTGVASEIAKADSRGNANPAGAARLESSLPGAFSSSGGAKQTATRKQALLDQAEMRIREMEAGHYNPAQVAVLRGDLEAARGHKGGSAPAAAAPTHYLISPDRKRRIPADAKGQPIGPEEPNPGG